MYCPNCGSPMAEGTRVCPSCGVEVTPPRAAPPPVRPAEPVAVTHRPLAPPPLQGAYPLATPVAPPFVPTTSTLAVLSLVMGIVSWVALPIVASIIGIILGHMARGEIRNSGGRIEGEGVAMGGLVVSYLNLGLGCIAVPCLLAVMFGGLAAIGAALPA